jgi:hypothetical protein
MRNTIEKGAMVPRALEPVFVSLLKTAMLVEAATGFTWKTTSYMHHHTQPTQPRRDMHKHGHCLDIAPLTSNELQGNEVAPPPHYEFDRVMKRSDPAICYQPELYHMLMKHLSSFRDLAINIKADIDLYVETDHIHIHIRPIRAKIVQWAKPKSAVYPDSEARHNLMREKYQKQIDEIAAGSRGDVSIKTERVVSR